MEKALLGCLPRTILLQDNVPPTLPWVTRSLVADICIKFIFVLGTLSNLVACDLCRLGPDRLIVDPTAHKISHACARVGGCCLPAQSKLFTHTDLMITVTADSGTMVNLFWCAGLHHLISAKDQDHVWQSD